MAGPTITAEPRRRTRADRSRVGYAAAIVVNALILGAVNQWPGWEAVPFLTDDTRQVLGWVNASIVVALVSNVLYAVADPPRLRAVGDGVQNAVGLVSVVRLWQVFPFDFPQGGFDWDLLARWVLAVGVFGAAVGVLVALVRLVRGGRR